MENEVLNAWLIEQGYTLVSQDTQALILGESHWEYLLEKEQEELIRLARPDFLLHEGGHVLFYDPQVGKEEPLFGFSRQELEAHCMLVPSFVFRRADELGFKIIGCDLGVLEKRSFDYQMADREERMGERIAEYARKTSKPVIAILGAKHVQPESAIHGVLDRNKVNYVIANQLSGTNWRAWQEGGLMPERWRTKSL